MLMEKVRGNDWKPVDDNYSIEPVPGSQTCSSLDVNIRDVAETTLLHQLKRQSRSRLCYIDGLIQDLLKQLQIYRTIKNRYLF